MNLYLKDIEKGKKSIRERNINLTVFKSVVSSYLHNANLLDEDDWVMYYNSYAWANSNRYEELPEWVKEFFQEYNKKQHRIWLRK